MITASDRIFPGLVYHDREKEFWDMGNLANVRYSHQRCYGVFFLNHTVFFFFNRKRHQVESTAANGIVFQCLGVSRVVSHCLGESGLQSKSIVLSTQSAFEC